MSSRVYVSTSSFATVSERPLRALRAAGYDVVLNPHGRKLKAEEVVSEVQGCVGLVAGTEPLGADTLAALAPTLKSISRVGVGMDKIDHAAAAELGIGVRNTPSAHVLPVAELALGGLLAACRHVVRADHEVRSGTWRKPMGRLLTGSTVGFVGYGQVARELHRLLEPFGVQAMACDPCFGSEEGPAGVRAMPLDELFATADVISLHLPGGAGTRGLIGAAQLERLRPGAILSNTARGDVIEEAAVLAWLNRDPSAVAVLDVYAKEPYTGPLTDLDNVILTPHIGSYAAEARDGMEVEAVHNLIDMLGEAS